MSKNFLHIAISTASSSAPRGYPGCSNSPSTLTPRKTPRGGSFATQLDSARLAPTSPLISEKLSPIPRRQRSKLYPYDQSSLPSNASSPTEDTSFLPCSPALLTPFLIQDGVHSKAEDHKLGTFSAINIILGKTIGVGIYSVPSSILSDVGSVGMALIIWILGAAISFCGLSVYLDLGTALPRSGGDKVYLERIFRKPKHLASCVFMAYVVLLGFSTPNCIVLGEYAMYALGIPSNRWNVRSIAVLAITISCAVHARAPKLGLFMINVLGVVKLFIIAVIIIAGFTTVLTGSKNASGEESVFSSNFSHPFALSSNSPHAYATALLKALYCFRGYSTANSVLSEVRNPVPTLRKAAPTALSLVAFAYILTNIAYLCVISSSVLASSGELVAGTFFTSVFGPAIGGNLLPVLVILSAFGSVAATSFAQARVNQELGKEKLLPFSEVWGSTSPWGTPAAGLFLHWIVSVAVIVLPPPGEIYGFLVALGAYPASVVSVAVSGGLLWLKWNKKEKWNSPSPAPVWAVMVFLIANLALIVLPWVEPLKQGEKKKMICRVVVAYWVYPAAGCAVLAMGFVWWVWWQWCKRSFVKLFDNIIQSSVVTGEIESRTWKQEIQTYVR